MPYSSVRKSRNLNKTKFYNLQVSIKLIVTLDDKNKIEKYIPVINKYNFDT